MPWASEVHPRKLTNGQPYRSTHRTSIYMKLWLRILIIGSFKVPWFKCDTCHSTVHWDSWNLDVDLDRLAQITLYWD